MRQRVSRILAVLLLAGAILARPQKTALPGILQDATKNATEGPPTQRNGDQSETVHNNTRYRESAQIGRSYGPLRGLMDAEEFHEDPGLRSTSDGGSKFSTLVLKYADQSGTVQDGRFKSSSEFKRSSRELFQGPRAGSTPEVRSGMGKLIPKRTRSDFSEVRSEVGSYSRISKLGSPGSAGPDWVPILGVGPQDSGTISKGRSDSSRSLVRIKPGVSESLPALFRDFRPMTLVTSKNPRPNSRTPVPSIHLKDWPSDGLQNPQDLFNYEKYTSFHEESSPILHQATVKPASKPKPVRKGKPSSVPPRGTTSTTLKPEPDVEEIVQWLQVPAFTTNQSHVVDEEGPIVNAFEPVFDNLEPNRPLVPEDEDYGTQVSNSNVLQGQRPQKTTYYHASSPTYVDPHPQSWHPVRYEPNDQDLEDLPETGSPVQIIKLKKEPTYNPWSQVTQNTVVHILNGGSRKPNVTVTKPGQPEIIQSANQSSISGPPNVHIMFASQQDATKDVLRGPDVDKSPEVTYDDDDLGCPTITINSYTKVNNTIQNKEGCTDLNIVINSHVVNTNVFKPGTEDPDLVTDDYEGEDYSDMNPNDKFYGVGTEYPGAFPDMGIYGTTQIYDQTTEDESSQTDKVPSEDDEDVPEVEEFDDDTSFDIYQGTDIDIGGQGPVDDGQLVDPENPASPVNPSNPANPVNSVSDQSSQPLSDTALMPSQGPLPSGSLPNPGSSGLDAPFSGSSSGGQLSSFPGLVSNLGTSQGGSLGSGGNRPSLSTALAPVDDDDDDDEDYYSLTTTGFMESVTYLFDSFSFMNPFSYGLFSMSIAPAAALAAGVFGVGAILFPWAFPAVLDLGRAADRVTIRFRPSLEEVINHSIHKYKHWNEWKSRRRKRKRVGDGPEKHRELKDFQYMDQSLRTVATQLLNVTNPDEVPLPADKIPGKGDLKVMTVSKMTALTPSSEATTSKNEKSDLIKDVNSEISAMESMGVGFGRPINSKFGYFEIGHPGEAMALTEEELEKELHSARLTTTKGQPTTTGGISTWILLNPPTSTLKPVQEKTKVKAEEKKKTSTKPPSTTNEKVVTKLKSEAKVTATTTMVKSTLQELPSTEKVSQSQGNDKFGTTKRPTTTRKPEKTSTTGQNVEKMAQSSSTATLKSATTPRPEKIEASTVQKTVTKKATTSPPRTTVKTKVTSSSSSTSSRPASTTSPRPVTPKVARPNFNRPKGPSRRTTPRPDTNKPSDGPATSTSKIEKVTFRPVQIVPANRKDVATSVSERPAFVTKIKASVLTENTKTTTSLPQVSEIPTVLKTNESKSTSPSTDLVEVPVRAKPGNKSNNVLKVQLKKPVDEPPSIEIEPIKVNAPILKIEKVEKLDKLEKETKKVAKGEGDDEDILDNSRIDLKFDFNPEVTMIEVQTSSEATSTASTTTKRPKNGSNKRKKNKVRRRRPSTTVGTTTLVPLVTLESNEVSVENSNSLQESKIEPETKVANATKNKKKPVQKPISTQIYNFLSREVMPSFGMMSLVGLGLGLASYFLYPFGGTIARRNYDVEPNYKYNLDEYGGNFGQNEEEVFSKVLQGMTNHDAKFGGIKDYESNYYRYQHYDGAYSEPQTTRKSDLKHSTSSGPMYRPLENTYDLNYRNTEFKYPDVITTPGSYYERPKQEFSVGNANPVNRQFVVGNVPKELELFEVAPTMGKDGRTGYQSGKEQVSGYAEEVAQAYAPVKEPDLPQGYDQPEAQALKSQDGYEEIEITPSAVAVEHGPRTLEDIDSMHPRSSRRRREVGIKNEEDLKKVEEHRPRVFKVSSWVHSRSPSRRKRDSVIQVIPSRSEVEKDEQEEDLSNEILDIIDSVIPGEGDVQTPKSAEKKPEEEDQKRRHKDKKTSQEKQPESTSASSGSTEEATTFTAGPTTRREEETSSGTALTSPSDSSAGSNLDFSSGSSSEIAETSSLASSEVSESTTDPLHTTEDWFDATTEKNHEEGNSGLFGFVKRVAEVKFRLGLTILKHASEGFARYLGHVQKRLNGEE